MTQKRKRGRPPGSGKKKEALASKIDFKPVTAEAYDAGKLPDTTIDEHPMYEKVFPKSDAEIKRYAFEKELREKGVATTPNKGILAVNADKFMPLPDDWFSLSKVQKLEWLTANPRK